MSPTKTTVDTMIHFQVGREVDAKLRTNDSAATSTFGGSWVKSLSFSILLVVMLQAMR